jgi:hypothetical protein
MNWKTKLSSRKLWTMLISIVTLVGASFGFTEAVVTQTVAILSAGGIAMTYIFGESNIDAANVEAEKTDVNNFNINGLSKEEVSELLKGWMEVNNNESTKQNH